MWSSIIDFVYNIVLVVLVISPTGFLEDLLSHITFNEMYIQEQCGFVEDTGTRNAIFIVRTLCERAIEVQHDLYLCFIDYAKAFDKVKHEDLFEFLQNLDIDGKDLRLIRNLYWEQSAAIRIDGNIGKYTQIRRGVRQGCVFSPDLFNLYSENILRDLNNIKGCIVGGYNLNNVRYADDAVLIAGSESELQELLNTVIDASLHRGLSINIKKTPCMVISKSKITPTCHIHINNETIKQVEKFKYLGSTITSDGRNDAEIKIRIGMAKDAFQKMEKVIKNKNITIETRNRILQWALRYSHTYLWQRVLDNITKHGKEVGSHRNVVSQKNATHILEGPCHKWWGIEERKNRE